MAQGTDSSWLVALIALAWIGGWGSSRLNDEAQGSDFTLVRCNPDSGLDAEMRCVHYAHAAANVNVRVNPMSHTVQIVFDSPLKNGTRERFFDNCVVVDLKNFDCVESQNIEIKPTEEASGLHVGSFQGRLYVRNVESDDPKIEYSSVGGLPGWAYRQSILPLKGALMLSGSPADLRPLSTPADTGSGSPPPLLIKPVEPPVPSPDNALPSDNASAAAP